MFIPFFLFWIVTLLTCASLFGQEGGTVDNMRNARYGEIIVVTGGPFSFTGHVYNTIGFSNCPDAVWKGLNAQQIKKEIHARGVSLNGPRYFLMDSVSVSDPIKIRTFDGLQARHITNLKIPLSTVIEGGAPPYTDTLLLKSTGLLFKKGRTVYELTSPKGDTYVMQSYPEQNDPHFIETDLATIGNRLTLPAGWSYRVRSLDQDLLLKPADKTYVLRDNLQNSYQKE
ncbi:MAG: hypothetical protein DVB29_07190 [Verrucomicrobia bacterium]|nr:MAG: hypothetical protein DVB29_07190 [Verrucomicrobiota bacterium]